MPVVQGCPFTSVIFPQGRRGWLWRLFRRVGARHVIAGLAGAIALLLVYIAVISVLQGFQHALQQAADMWYWIAALAVGFGVQVGLFSFMRHEMKSRQAAATASVAASGGVSAGSMVACCAHHLTDVLAAIGIAGVAVVLVQYQTVFILLGVLSNLVGITIVLEAIQCQGLSDSRLLDRCNMKKVKKGTMALSAVVLVAAAALTYLK